MGARSKRFRRFRSSASLATRLPLWGRDQNPSTPRCRLGFPLPDCPCGGEIKTRPVLQRLSEKGLPDCPCGGEIKTAFSGGGVEECGYQTAPVGARSKLLDETGCVVILATRLPLWGRDQNLFYRPLSLHAWLPDCPCGGEIKTDGRVNFGGFEATRLPLWGRDQNSSTPRLVVGRGYQTAPVGARSKLGELAHLCISVATRLPLWGRDQNPL